MYPSIRPAAARAEAETAGTDETPGGGSRVSANVIFLGLTSFFTDISSESVNGIITLYLLFQLRFSFLELGIFNGIYLGLSGVVTVWGAVITDRHGRYKEIAGAGYATSAVAKLGLIATRNAAWPASAVLFVDRTGKGARTAPRDALISLSADKARLATAFGVHRAFDSAGGVIGPLLAFLILRSAPTGYDTIFVVSFLFALLGLGVLVLFVQNRDDGHRGSRGATWRGAMRLLERKDFRTLVIVGTLFGLFTIADAEIFTTIFEHSSYSSSIFPLFFTGMQLSYLILAIPVGNLADRVGRSRVYVVGFFLMFAIYWLLLTPTPDLAHVLVILGLLGAFYACTDGVLIAMASTAITSELRTSGIAVLTTSASISIFASSLAWGFFADRWGLTTTVKIFMVVLGAMLLVSAFLLRIRSRRYG